jgi:hypothetical protein
VKRKHYYNNANLYVSWFQKKKKLTNMQVMKILEQFTDFAQRRNCLLADIPVRSQQVLTKLQQAGQGLAGLPLQFWQAVIAQFQRYFTPYLPDGEGEVVGLSLRAAALHPRYGHLSFLSPAQRDAVWNAVLADARELMAKEPADPVRSIFFF